MHALHTHNRIQARRQSSRRSGFSLTELLVVIGIIIVLVGLLLVALGEVQKKAKRTRTEATMNQFANACAAFQTEHGFYPGVIPDEVINANPDGNGNPQISSTENALLHLMGGYRVLSPMDPQTAGSTVYDDYVAYAGTELTFGAGANSWRLKVNPQRIGEGPVINSKPYQPVFTPGADDVATSSYPISPEPLDTTPTNDIPELVDAWGQPILFIKQSRTRGPLVDRANVLGVQPQFVLGGLARYVESEQLGELSRNQMAESILHIGSADQQDKVLSAILAHPAFYKVPPPASNDPRNSAARGAFVLISAGPDGVYFSAKDGPGSSAAPVSNGNIDAEVINAGPKVIDSFDDIRIFGGG